MGCLVVFVVSWLRDRLGAGSGHGGELWEAVAAVVPSAVMGWGSFLAVLDRFCLFSDGMSARWRELVRLGWSSSRHERERE